jgi:3-hydroxybutyryl-CoA dehydratase
MNATNLYEGQSASLTRTVLDEDVRSFAALSGDTNPVHLDEVFAEQTRFKGRIAHGMLCASYISAVLGTKLPGPGVIYLSQTLRFLAPVYVRDTVTATVVVAHVREDKPIVTLDTKVSNQNGDVVATGEAVVLLDNVASPVRGDEDQ